MVGQQAERARGVRVDLDDHDPFGIGGRPDQLAERGAGVQRQAQPAVVVGRRGQARPRPAG